MLCKANITGVFEQRKADIEEIMPLHTKYFQMKGQYFRNFGFISQVFPI